jgi:hypothetical protein
MWLSWRSITPLARSNVAGSPIARCRIESELRSAASG